MMEMHCRLSQAAICAALAAALVLAPPLIATAQPSKTELWFDPTQLPSFTGVVDRFLPNPDGSVDRLIFKEGPQIAFPPDAFEAVREVAPVGRPLIVWGIRARSAPVITMLAFGVPDGEPTILDRFYWRPDPGQKHARQEILLIGTVWVPYLSPQGKTAGAILENGDIIRVEPKVAALLKERFVAGAKIVAEGTGVDTPLGKAMDAERIGAAIATLERLPSPEPAAPGGEPPSAR